MKKTVLLVVVFAFVGSALLFYKAAQKDIAGPEDAQIAISGTGGFVEAEFIPAASESAAQNTQDAGPQITAPNLDRPIAFPDGTLPEIEKRMRENIENIIAFLEENPDSYDNWLSIGLYWKSLNDFEGAREAWEYAEALRPFESTPTLNLANLYGYYLNDTQKAKEYYQKAIEKDVYYIHAYVQGYTYFYEKGDMATAREFLELGLKNNPTSVQLKNIMNELNQ